MSDATPPDRLCTVCRTLKPIRDFHSMGAGRWRHQCGSCWAEVRPDRGEPRWHPETPEQKRDRRLKGLYGITPDQYQAMLTAQAGLCAICRREEPANRALAVDHCHKTGVVRALLCTPCNTQLGIYEVFGESARAYLAAYSQGSEIIGAT